MSIAISNDNGNNVFVEKEKGPEYILFKDLSVPVLASCRIFGIRGLYVIFYDSCFGYHRAAPLCTNNFNNTLSFENDEGLNKNLWTILDKPITLKNV